MSKRKSMCNDISGSSSSTSNTILSDINDIDSNNDKQQQLQQPIVSLKEEVKELQEIRDSLTPVLSYEESRDLVLDTVWVTNIDPKLASTLNSQFSKYIQTNQVYKEIQEQFGHIKKLRKITSTSDNKTYLELFLCTFENYQTLLEDFDNTNNNNNTINNNNVTTTTTTTNNNNNKNDLLHQYDEKDYQSFIIEVLTKNKLNRPYTVQLPKYPPLHLSQCPKWNAVWPCTFKYHPFSTPLVENLDDQELKPMKKYMKLAIEQANIAKSLGYRPIGGVLVDPYTDTIVMSSHDLIPNGKISQSTPIKQDSSSTKRFLLSPFLSHCTMNLIHELAESHRQLYGNRTYDKKKNNNYEKVGDDEEEDDGEEEDEEQYLANSYHLYLTREPCVMCSMALVHSRIERVIYGSQQLSGGGLGGCFRIHTEKSINHRFQVYRGLMEKECLDLFTDGVEESEENSAIEQQIIDNITSTPTPPSSSTTALTVSINNDDHLS